MMWKFNKFGNQVAAIDDNSNMITYGQLDELSQEMQALCSRKLVFLFCHNSIGSFAGYAAMLNAKVVPVMISDDLNKELRQNLLETYLPDYLWVPENMKDVFCDAQEVMSKYGYKLLKTNFLSGETLYDELALLLTTSGSTGSPKLVRQSYTNIRANMEAIASYLKLDDKERPVTTLPMNYTYGLSIINSHLYVGATILITDKTLMQKEFWAFVKKEQATSFGGVPYTYEMLKKLRFFRMDLPSLKTMTQAGGKLTPELHHEFAEFAKNTGRNFVVMYGQTEATARMSYLPPEKSLEKYGSMGIAIPGGKFTLIDAEGKQIDEPNVVGELVYEGANVTLGYGETRADLAKGDERGGRLETGDMAKRDEDGYYYIVGRKKRFLKMFGKRINLDEVDRILKGKYDGLDCACAGVDDKMYIFINNESILEEAKAYIAEVIHVNMSAIRMKYLETIPKNSAGKTLYVELEKYYE